ncbi:carboxylate--amine ligase [Haloterrigena sp. SYSU A558-1]|uniref:Carboxylate--amine ligase n=1 Tax=Haloterrigena gelatinilytica TaxID=2741724 RepID=A0ABX2LFL7_9EURY|nr:carboxylate--amine ligase [Haloterrigena gelatinilytica]NUC73350.1 carboxylate--amine ligase [Haloterrigena gelatinilytica]
MSDTLTRDDRSRRVRDSIVVPAVSVPSSDCCLRSLSPAGVRTIVVSEEPTAKSFCSRHCDEAVLVPDPAADLEGYATALLALARREDVRTVVPAREPDAFVLSKYRDAFAEHVATPWPTLETLRRVHDRVRLAEAAEAAGVPVPETRPLEAVDAIARPSVVKSRYNLLVDEYVESVPPGRVRRSKTVEHLRPGAAVEPASLRETFGHDPIVQEFVPIDEEYMVGALYERGEPVATVQHRQFRGTSYAGGGGVYRESVHSDALEDAALSLLDELEWHGLACIEYMRHPETGEFYLTEINPRLWTSLAANARMGADFPRYYWRMATDRADEIDAGYDVGVGCHYLKGELAHVLSHFHDDSELVDRPSIADTLRAIARSCYEQPNFDLLSRDDPWPFVQDVLAELDRGVLEGIGPADLGYRASGAEQPVDWREAAPADAVADANADVHASSTRDERPPLRESVEERRSP